MIGQRQRLALIARTLAWPALIGGAALCIAIIVLTSLDVDSSPRARWPGLGALALCVGAAFVLDDPARATTDASPTSLAKRRMLRIALALPLLAGVWAASLYYATSADGTPLGPDARGALSIQASAMLATTLGALDATPMNKHRPRASRRHTNDAPTRVRYPPIRCRHGANSRALCGLPTLAILS